MNRSSRRHMARVQRSTRPLKGARTVAAPSAFARPARGLVLGGLALEAFLPSAGLGALRLAGWPEPAAHSSDGRAARRPSPDSGGNRAEGPPALRLGPTLATAEAA